MKDKIQSLFNVEGWFGIAFIMAGVATQAVAYALSEDSLLSLISGIAGVISVVLCSQRKLSFYFWGFLQIGTFMALCINEHLYGKLFENGFYLITMIAGLLMWKRNLSGEEVKTRALSMNVWNVLLCGLFSFTLCLALILVKIGGCCPVIDSVTTTFAIAAQILMILRYKENWILWFWVDVLCIILWVQVGNWCMVAQYIFWTMNCIYGLIKWNNNINK